MIDMKRRGFLGACLAAGVAPMICKAEILMPVRKSIDPYNVLVPVYFDYCAPNVDATVVSVWAKCQGEWRRFSQEIIPRQRPFVMVKVPRSMGVSALLVPNIEVGDTIRIQFP